MAFLKRPEVWILLLLSIAGIVWVLWSDRAHDETEAETVSSEPEKTETADEPETRFTILERRVSREQDHLILTLRIGHARETAGEKPLILAEPAVRLVTEGGSTISPFFLPFDPPPILEPDSGASANLRYWLPATQASAALWLEMDGDRLAVKEATGAELTERFAEGAEVAVNGLDWQP